MAKAVAFPGNSLSQEWAEAIRPKGSELIIHIQAEWYDGLTSRQKIAVFRNKNTKKIDLYHYCGVPHRVDEPHAALKGILSRTPAPSVVATITDAEIQELISDTAIAEEQALKQKEISQITEKLEDFRDQLEYIQDWQKAEKITDPDTRLDALYLLADIAGICNTIEVNLLATMINEPKKTTADTEGESLETTKAAGL